MDIDLAIKKLNDFKALSNSLGECDLVGLDEDAFTVRVKLKKPEDEKLRRVVGFCPPTKKQHKQTA